MSGCDRQLQPVARGPRTGGGKPPLLSLLCANLILGDARISARLAHLADLRRRDMTLLVLRDTGVTARLALAALGHGAGK